MNPIGPSAKDGLLMGISYTVSLIAMSLVRQILGTGILSFSNPFTNQEIFALRLIPKGFEIPMFSSQVGAFLTFACLAAAIAAYKNSLAAKEKAKAKGAK
jgi:electron transport complex protein RnfE